jgi:hypothetical protein
VRLLILRRRWIATRLEWPTADIVAANGIDLFARFRILASRGKERLQLVLVKGLMILGSCFLTIPLISTLAFSYNDTRLY